MRTLRIHKQLRSQPLRTFSLLSLLLMPLLASAQTTIIENVIAF